MLKFQTLTNLIKDSCIVPKDLNGIDWDVWVDNFILEAVKREIAHVSQSNCYMDFDKNCHNCKKCSRLLMD